MVYYFVTQSVADFRLQPDTIPAQVMIDARSFVAGPHAIPASVGCALQKAAKDIQDAALLRRAAFHNIAQIYYTRHEEEIMHPEGYRMRHAGPLFQMN